MPTLTLPALALVVLVGPAAAERAAFAQQHFAPAEILALADFRAGAADDADAQAQLLHRAGQRLAAGQLTVLDAAHAGLLERQPPVALARRHYVMPVALVLGQPEPLHLEREGFRLFFTLPTPEAAAAATVVRAPLPPDRRDLPGPFDLIGDVHGCLAELQALLAQLGYTLGEHVLPPPGRTAVFLGDLVDRGPDVPGVLQLVMDMVAAGIALCVPGNHDAKLVRHLQGKNVRLTNGLAESVAQLAAMPLAFRQQVLAFLAGRPSHYVLAAGQLVVAHAGLKAAMHLRDTSAVREFALYGATNGQLDALGLPVRLNWAADYHGAALVLYGHTPVPEPEWLNGTLNIDTGCVFGGRLTALRYPEKELVSVPAARAYAFTNRPLGPLTP